MAGNTDLKGTLIAGTEAGTAANSLITGTLTQSEIENHATMEASSIGLGGSTTSEGTGERPASGKGTTGLMNMGPSGTAVGVSGLAATSSDDSSTTRKGISAGTITVTDSAAQAALAGADAKNSIDRLNRDVDSNTDTSGKLGNNLNLAEVHATLNVSANFAAAAAYEVGSYAETKLDEAAQLVSDAAKLPDGVEKSHKLRLAAEMNDSWKEGGTSRVALHAVVGGIAGGTGGALGAGATGLATPAIVELISNLDAPGAVKQALILAAGAVVGAVAGGSAGAVSATSEVANNYLKHQELGEFRDKLAACDVKKCSPAEREKIVEYYANLSKKNDASLAACLTRECIDGHAKEIQAASALKYSVLQNV